MGFHNLVGYERNPKPCGWCYSLAQLLQRQQSSTCIVLSVSAILSVRIFIQDENQAYLQSRDSLTRPILFQPRGKNQWHFFMEADHLLELQLPSNGFCEAGDYWNATATEHVKDELQMTSLTGNLAVFVKDGAEGIEGLLVRCTDDFRHGGNESFRDLT